MGRRRGAVRTIAAALVLVFPLPACGVSVGDGPRPIDSDIAELLQPEEAPTTSETDPQRVLTVTWVRGDKLKRAARLGVAETRQEQLDAALIALLGGPSPAERTRGFTTLLPPDVQVVGEVKRGRAVIALELGAGLEPGGLPLAVGQVALTALAVPRVRTVVFTVDGTRTSVPVPSARGSGRETVRVVRESDYRTVLAN